MTKTVEEAPLCPECKEPQADGDHDICESCEACLGTDGDGECRDDCRCDRCYQRAAERAADHGDD